jgi:hypothetical protein
MGEIRNHAPLLRGLFFPNRRARDKVTFRYNTYPLTK